MKFFNERRPNSVVTVRRNHKIRKRKRIARFKDGEFETEDPVLIEKLKKHYKNDGIEFKTLNYWKLRRMAEDKGLKHHNLKKVDLVRLLEGSERNE